jgi:hypothetical protein
MQINSPELLNQISVWRQKSADGTITLEEMREAVKLLRGNRLGAQNAAAASKAKSKSSSGPSKSAGDLLSELDGL